MESPLGGIDGPSEDSSSDQRPLISLVVAMWNVEQYLPAFLESLSQQGEALRHTEIIFVDDGSPDACGELARTWLESYEQRGTVMIQANSGVAAARNLGLSHASGEWVSFPDPDDMLDSNYLGSIVTMIAKNEFADTTLIAANLIYLDDESGSLRDNYPLNYCFGDAPELVALNDQPQRIKLAANSSFYRRSIIESNDLQFDSKIVPTGEDAVFTMQYHLHTEDPRVLFVPHARYLYRKRTASDSLMDRRFSVAENYSVRPKLQWIENLAYAHSQLGTIPRWLEHMVLYSMQWYFAADQRLISAHHRFHGPILDQFLTDTEQALSYISPEVISEFDAVRISRQTKAAMLALAKAPAHQHQIQTGHADLVKGEIQLRYFFAGERPREEFFVGGKRIEPRYEKTRGIDYFGRQILFERILWLPDHQDLTATLDGTPATIGRFPETVGPRKPRRTRAAQELNIWSKVSRFRRQVRNILTGRSRRIAQLRAKARLKIASSWIAKQKFADAWVFIDTPYRAQDNAEHLYRWVQRNRPNTNAYFVLSRGTKDWDRLSSEGFRMIAYDSFRHKILHENAVALVSSHFPPKWMRKVDGNSIGSQSRKFVYLKHGPTKNDVSRSHNQVDIDLYVAGGARELEALAGDFTNYKFTAKEVILTGMPRYDSLLQKAGEHRPEDKRLITVMPTWRSYLNNPKSNTQSPISREDFLQTEFFKAWMAFLSDRSLQTAAAKNQLEILFLPHSNIADLISEADLPPNVTFMRLIDGDIQDILARTAIAITDYSSIVMDSAFIGTPVVYYQFDAEEFYTKQGYRRSYFDDAVDGFGPVCHDSQAAITATIALVENPDSFPDEYHARARDFFKFRDGKNCERIYGAIVDALTPASE